MTIGRAINCDLCLLLLPDGGPQCFGQRTSAAVRVGVYADALVEQGVDLQVTVTDNPRRPTSVELRAQYDPEANAFRVSDLALDAGSHLSTLAVCRAQYNVYRAVAEYLTHPAPELPAEGDQRRQRPGFQGLPPALVPAPRALRADVHTAFVRLYAFKELSLAWPAEEIAGLQLDSVAPVPVVQPPDAPPAHAWEEAFVKDLGLKALAELRAHLDHETDEIARSLDTDLNVVLNRLAASCPELHRHPFYRTGVAGPAVAEPPGVDPTAGS